MVLSAMSCTISYLLPHSWRNSLFYWVEGSLYRVNCLLSLLWRFSYYDKTSVYVVFRCESLWVMPQSSQSPLDGEILAFQCFGGILETFSLQLILAPFRFYSPRGTLFWFVCLGPHHFQILCFSAFFLFLRVESLYWCIFKFVVFLILSLIWY